METKNKLKAIIDRAQKKYLRVAVAVISIDDPIQDKEVVTLKIEKELEDFDGEKYIFDANDLLVCLEGLERVQTILLFEKIRTAVETDLQTTISIGVAFYPDDGKNAAELAKKADSALNKAEKGGRNKVCIARHGKMVRKTASITYNQARILKNLVEKTNREEASLLREAIDDLERKYNHNGPSFFIIDDSRTMRTSIKNILLNNGFSIAGEAVNSIGALEQLEEVTPDFILLDLQMPEMDGLLFLEKYNKKADTKIIMLSTLRSPNNIIEGFRLGADSYLAQPFRESKLIEAINSLIEKGDNDEYKYLNCGKQT